MQKMSEQSKKLLNFGIASLFTKRSQIYFESIFSTFQVGRVVDLFCYTLKDSLLPVSMIRDPMSQLLTEVCGLVDSQEDEENPSVEPVLIEAGFDDEKLLYSVAFLVPENPSENNELFSGLEQRITPDSTNPFEKKLYDLMRVCDEIIIRSHGAKRKLEITFVLYLDRTRALPLEKRAARVVVLEGAIPVQDAEAAYLSAGDLDQPEIENGKSSGNGSRNGIKTTSQEQFSGNKGKKLNGENTLHLDKGDKNFVDSTMDADEDSEDGEDATDTEQGDDRTEESLTQRKKKKKNSGTYNIKKVDGKIVTEDGVVLEGDDGEAAEDALAVIEELEKRVAVGEVLTDEERARLDTAKETLLKIGKAKQTSDKDDIRKKKKKSRSSIGEMIAAASTPAAQAEAISSAELSEKLQNATPEEILKIVQETMSQEAIQETIQRTLTKEQIVDALIKTRPEWVADAAKKEYNEKEIEELLLSKLTPEMKAEALATASPEEAAAILKKTISKKEISELFTESLSDESQAEILAEENPVEAAKALKKALSEIEMGELLKKGLNREALAKLLIENLSDEEAAEALDKALTPEEKAAALHAVEPTRAGKHLKKKLKKEEIERLIEESLPIEQKAKAIAQEMSTEEIAEIVGKNIDEKEKAEILAKGDPESVSKALRKKLKPEEINEIVSKNLSDKEKAEILAGSFDEEELEKLIGGSLSEEEKARILAKSDPEKAAKILRRRMKPEAIAEALAKGMNEEDAAELIASEMTEEEVAEAIKSKLSPESKAKLLAKSAPKSVAEAIMKEMSEKEMLEALHSSLSKEEIAQALSKGLTQQKLTQLLSESMTPEQIAQVISTGLPKEQLASILREGTEKEDVVQILSGKLSKEEMGKLIRESFSKEELNAIMREQYPEAELARIMGDTFSKEDMQMFDGMGSGINISRENFDTAGNAHTFSSTRDTDKTQIAAADITGFKTLEKEETQQFLSSAPSKEDAMKFLESVMPIGAAETLLNGSLPKEEIEKTLKRIVGNEKEAKALANHFTKMQTKWESVDKTTEKKAAEKKAAEEKVEKISKLESTVAIKRPDPVLTAAADAEVLKSKKAVEFYQLRVKDLEQQLKQMEIDKNNAAAEAKKGLLLRQEKMDVAGNQMDEDQKKIDAQKKAEEKPKAEIENLFPAHKAKASAIDGEQIPIPTLGGVKNDGENTEKPSAVSKDVNDSDAAQKAAVSPGGPEKESVLVSKFKLKVKELETELRKSEDERKLLQQKLKKELIAAQSQIEKSGDGAAGKPDKTPFPEDNLLGVMPGTVNTADPVKVLSGKLRDVEAELRKLEEEKKRLTQEHKKAMLTKGGKESDKPVIDSSKEETLVTGEKAKIQNEDEIKVTDNKSANEKSSQEPKSMAFYQKRVRELEQKMSEMEAEKTKWLQQYKKDLGSMVADGSLVKTDGSLVKTDGSLDKTGENKKVEELTEGKAIAFYQKKMQELETSLRQAEEKLKNEINNAKKDLYLKKGEDLKNSESQDESDQLVSGKTFKAIDDDKFIVKEQTTTEGEQEAPGELEKEVSDGVDGMGASFDSLISSAETLKAELGDERAKKRVDSFLGEIARKKEELNQLTRKLTSQVRKKELDYKTAEMLIKDDLKKAKVSIGQKQNQIDRMKDLMTSMQAKFDDAKAQASSANSDSTSTRLKIEAMQRQFDDVNQKYEKLKVESINLKKQEAPGNAKGGELQKQLDAVNAALKAKKQEVELVKRTVNEKGLAEAELKKKINLLQNEINSLKANTPAAIAAATPVKKRAA